MNNHATQIKRAFNRAHLTYDDHCEVQIAAGTRLLSSLTGAPQHILDLGCGTGIVTEKLAQQFPKSKIHAIDIANNLLQIARHRLAPYRIHCDERDFNCIDYDFKFDLIFSNMALHWSKNIISTITKVARHLSSNGLLAFSIPLAGTFHELQSHFAVNSFIDLAILKTQLSQHEFTILCSEQQTITQHFPNTLCALKSIKAVGANATQPASQQKWRGKSWLKKVDIRQLTYKLGFLVINNQPLA